MDFKALADQEETKQAIAKLNASVAPTKRRPLLTTADLDRQEAMTQEERDAEEAQYQEAFERDMTRQQAAAQEQLNEHRVDEQRKAKAKPGPKKQKDSKRNSDDWVAFTAFLRPDTRERLQKLIHGLKMCGINNPDDQSEAMEAALAPYLNKMEKQLRAKLSEEI